MGVIHEIRPDPKIKPIRLKGKAKTEFRKKVFKRAGGMCHDCGNYAPRLWHGVFNRLWCGHVSHIKSYGAGGGDTMDNVHWKCNECHITNGHLKWRSDKSGL